MNKEKGFNLKEIIIIIVTTAILTSLTTGVIVYNQNKLTKNVTYKDLSEDKALLQFLNVYASLTDEYYENVDKTEMLESAIDAMMNYLGEDYSTYMSKEETESLAEKLLGEYKGIGVQLTADNEIVNFIQGGSAEDAGLQIGDRIIKINGEDTTSMASKALAQIIENTKVGEKIDITVKRGEEQLNFQVENRRILVPAIESKILEDNIGYLKISTFSSTLSEQVTSAIKELEAQGMQSLIIDVRDNTGGYLSAASDVASIFLEKDQIIYSLENKDELEEYKDQTDESRNYNIVILFNENSASASEVLIAALQDNGKALTVGSTSYGKGKVQETQTLEDGSMVKYTTARWLTPKGICIDGEGITPLYSVTDDENTSDVDEQLIKAIEVIKENNQQG